MKKVIRRGIFETNSSSMHSCVITENPSQLPFDRYLDNEGFLNIELGEFGWGYDEFTSFPDKLSYLATLIFGYWDYDKTWEEAQKKIETDSEWERIVDCCKSHIEGCKGVNILESKGYVDHQSMDTVDGFLNANNTTLDDFLFNEGTLIIDNDNH